MDCAADGGEGVAVGFGKGSVEGVGSGGGGRDSRVCLSLKRGKRRDGVVNADEIVLVQLSN